MPANANKQPNDLTDGMMRFCYEGLIADCAAEKFDAAVQDLASMSAKERKRFMKSVRRCLDRFIALGAAMTEQDRIDCCADVSLFFANEAVEGRLENYKAAVQ